MNSIILITTFQINMLNIFNDIAENRLDVLIDDLIIFENSYYFNQILVQRKKNKTQLNTIKFVLKVIKVSHIVEVCYLRWLWMKVESERKK